MTRDKVLIMEAGRELDALVAEKVMGVNTDRFIWKRYGKPDSIQNEDYGGPRHYSTDIDAAWQVVEKLEQHPDEILFSCSRKGGKELVWEMRFRKCRGNQHDYIASAPTAPLAICRAALLTLGGSDELDW
jgi:hypothetical protein